MSETGERGVTKGDGYAVANLTDLGDGYGFRKIRKELGVTAFGANAIVIPPSYETGSHLHEEQEELYFLHSGRIEIEFGDGTSHELAAGGKASGSRARFQHQGGDGELEGMIQASPDVQRIMFDSQAGCKLSRPRVRGFARHVRQCDGVRQMRMRRSS